MISDALAFMLLLAYIQSFLVFFIPGFYIPYVLFRKRKQDQFLPFMLALIIGAVVGISGQYYVSTSIANLVIIHKNLPTVVFYGLPIVEIILVVTHYRKTYSKHKTQKR